jgi:acyl-CoA synthetase (AMP-forming)/AMP-acid ligase II
MALENFLNGRITEEDTYRYTLPEILHARAEHTGGQTAFIFLKDGEDEEERITYRELDEAARSIAYQLLTLSKPGERALMLFPPGLGFIKALFGVFNAAIIGVPAYPPRKNRSLERIRLMVADSGATVVLTTGEIFRTFEKNFQEVDELKTLTWIVSDDSFPDTGKELHQPRPEEIALLQYTSGSTGQPKGVMVAHSNIMRNCEFIRNSFGFSTKSVGVSWLPSFHDMGLVGQIFQPVYTGFPCVYMAPVSFFQKPIRWLKAFTKYSGTMGGAPNFAYDLLVDSTSAEEREDLDLSSIKTIYCGAEPIRRATFERFIDLYTDYGLRPEMMYPCYGMAETTLITTGPVAGTPPVYLGVSAAALERHRVKIADDGGEGVKYLVGVGHPWMDTSVRIVDPVDLTECGPDVVGEIWVSGSSVTKGYFNKLQETRESYSARLANDQGPFYLRTGDLGFFHKGELFISGRLKDLIIIRGRNYYPQDIEFTAEGSHPALRANASAAFSVEVDEEERLAIVAEVERTALRNLDAEAVCDAIRQQVAAEFELEVYAIQLLRTNSIFKTSSGKIQRKACREGFLEKSLEVVGESILDYTGPVEVKSEYAVDMVDLQAWLMSWMHIRLKVPMERIDLSKPITAHGLNSLKAVQLQQDFLLKYGVNFPPYLFFEKIPAKELCERALRLIREGE